MTNNVKIDIEKILNKGEDECIGTYHARWDSIFEYLL